MPFTIQRLVARGRALTKGEFSQVLGLLLGLAIAVLAVLAVAVLVPEIRWFAALTGIALAVVLSTFSILLLSRLHARVLDAANAEAVNWHLDSLGGPPKNFFMDGAAATPSLQLVLLKVLAFCRPLRILELGSGQTTKILADYCRRSPDARLLTLEQDKDWHDRLRAAIGAMDNHRYLHAPLTPAAVSVNGTSQPLATVWYSVPENELSDGSYDLVLVDGPDHGGPGTEYVPNARSGVLKVLAALPNSFVVILDDAEREGEAMTVKLIESLFNQLRRPYRRFDVHGVKTQVVFCSPDFAFLASS